MPLSRSARAMQSFRSQHEIVLKTCRSYLYHLLGVWRIARDSSVCNASGIAWLCYVLVTLPGNSIEGYNEYLGVVSIRKVVYRSGVCILLAFLEDVILTAAIDTSTSSGSTLAHHISTNSPIAPFDRWLPLRFQPRKYGRARTQGCLG